MSDIESLRALLAAATLGPWESGTDGWVETVSGDGEDWCYVRRVGTASDVMAQMLHGWEADEQTLRDAELIAAMRNALPTLLDRLEAAEAAVGEWELRHAAWIEAGCPTADEDITAWREAADHYEDRAKAAEAKVARCTCEVSNG